MAKDRYLVALDQGTTSTRSIVFSAAELKPLHIARREFAQHYPANGWVEHDATQIWEDAKAVLCEARDYIAAQGGGAAAALGITNQRETVLLWDRASGEPLHRAIVWQDRRTAKRCAKLQEEGALELVRSRSGLVLDPYFSATKLKWLLDETGAHERAARGEVLAGTIDAWLVWRLTAGKVFATDVTNASRTQLFALAALDWDPELLALHEVPRACLPEVKDCAADYGTTELLGGSTPICGIAGDQQAAAIGQACLERGQTKATYGTGCFVIVQGDAKPIVPAAGLLGTVGYRVGDRLAYAAEGSIFIAGAAIQWLRDRLGIIASAPASAELAAQAKPGSQVYVVPAFTGLGAPHWNPHARAAIYGLTQDSGRAEIVRATLEALGYASCDLLDAFVAAGLEPGELGIDGGMAANDWFAQFLADVADRKVSRPASVETTATGAAFLAGLQAGVYGSLADMAKLRQVERAFAPAMQASERARRLAGWHKALEATLAFSAGS